MEALIAHRAYALMRLVDAGVAFGVAGWIGPRMASGVEIHHQSVVRHTVSVDGSAVREIGRRRDPVAGLSFIGDAIGRIAIPVQRAGASAVAGSGSSAGSIWSRSVLLAVAVVPSVPVFGLCLPLRSAWQRDACAVRMALRARWLDVGLTAFLAQRAVLNVGSGRFRAAVNGYGEPGERPTGRLAAGELSLLGIDSGSSEHRRGRS